MNSKVHHPPECVCKHCKDVNRHFANMLRNWLGLGPLYINDRSKSPNYKGSTVFHKRRSPNPSNAQSERNLEENARYYGGVDKIPQTVKRLLKR